MPARGPGCVHHPIVTHREAAGTGDRLVLSEEVGILAEDRDTQDAAVAVVADDELADDDLDELLVEEVSIDGMCGVY